MTTIYLAHWDLGNSGNTTQAHATKEGAINALIESLEADEKPHPDQLDRWRRELECWACVVPHDDDCYWSEAVTLLP